MIDWKIQARARACQACAQAFADKQPYYTLLYDRKQALERWDVCAGCWESQYSHGANNRKDFLSFWQGVYSAPAPPPPEPIQKETAESMLRKLLELNDPQYTAACFILAVMLERKRLLKVKAQTVDHGQRTFVYEHARNGDLFTILDPNLQLQQLDDVQRNVAALLEHGFETAAEASPRTSAPVTEAPAGPAVEAPPAADPAP